MPQQKRGVAPATMQGRTRPKKERDDPLRKRSLANAAETMLVQSKPCAASACSTLTPSHQSPVMRNHMPSRSPSSSSVCSLLWARTSR